MSAETALPESPSAAGTTPGSRTASKAGGGAAAQELQALLDAAVDAVVVIDGQGRIERFNRAAEQMFGFRASEIVGRNVSVLMPEPERSAHDGHLRRYLETGISRIIGVGREVRALRRDGSVFPVSLAVGRVAGAGRPGFVGFIRDISRSITMERAATQAQQRLAQVARLSTMGEMAAGLAHELGQPLAAITTSAQGCRQLLDSSGSADLTQVRDALGEISHQALRAAAVIRRLQVFLADKGVNRRPIRCNRLLEDLVALARPDLHAHDVVLRLSIEPCLPDIVVDAVQVQQVLINLIRNAIDATLEDDVRPREILLSAASVEGGVEIAVKDRGTGVDPNDLDRLFTPFFTTKPHGTGLGLAVSSTIVQAHGGRLSYRERRGGGACFHFTLPALRLDEA
jgi:two-component system sensor kinase FixL